MSNQVILSQILSLTQQNQELRQQLIEVRLTNEQNKKDNEQLRSQLEVVNEQIKEIAGMMNQIKSIGNAIESKCDNLLIMPINNAKPVDLESERIYGNVRLLRELLVSNDDTLAKDLIDSWNTDLRTTVLSKLNSDEKAKCDRLVGSTTVAPASIPITTTSDDDFSWGIPQVVQAVEALG